MAAGKDWDSARDYAVAGASQLPFADGSFDLAVAYNALMDVEDMPAAVREARRAWRPDGTLVISIVHPLFDHGRFDGEGPDAPFMVGGSYFERQRFEGADERDRLTMPFAGWLRPPESCFAALEAADFEITSLREPQAKLDGADERLRRFERVPMFLWLKARALAV